MYPRSRWLRSRRLPGTYSVLLVVQASDHQTLLAGVVGGVVPGTAVECHGWKIPPAGPVDTKIKVKNQAWYHTMRLEHVSLIPTIYVRSTYVHFMYVCYQGSKGELTFSFLLSTLDTVSSTSVKMSECPKVCACSRRCVGFVPTGGEDLSTRDHLLPIVYTFSPTGA